MKSNTKDPLNNRQMSVEIAWKQNILVTDFHLLKSLLVVLGFGSQAFVCGFSRQNINSVVIEKNFENFWDEGEDLQGLLSSQLEFKLEKNIGI